MSLPKPLLIIVPLTDCHMHQIPTYEVEDIPKDEQVTIQVTKCTTSEEVEQVGL